MGLIPPSEPSRRGKEPPPGGALLFEGGIARVYDPLVKTPLLWATFALLDPTGMKPMLKFARKHGRLGLGPYPGWYPPEVEEPPDREEYVMHWQREIVRMKAIWELYDVLAADDNSLSNWVRSNIVPHPRNRGGPKPDDPSKHPHLLLYVYDRASSPRAPGGHAYDDHELARRGWAWAGLVDPNEPRNVVRTVIADMVNEGLRGRAWPILKSSKRDVLATFRVSSLLGAMYAQIWQEFAIGEEGWAKQCRQCEKPFKPEYRSHQIYCHDPCYGSRVRMRRLRRKKPASS